MAVVLVWTAFLALIALVAEIVQCVLSILEMIKDAKYRMHLEKDSTGCLCYIRWSSESEKKYGSKWLPYFFNRNKHGI